jgi:quercetin dioxygenase-like cupin family protein
MSFLVEQGSAPTITYAGRPMAILAGLSGQPTGFAVAELQVPAAFAGPPPHAHDTFDEGIYVLEGTLLVAADAEPLEAVPGTMFVAPRGQRHSFANPSARPARVLGLWGPAEPAMEFMQAIGAVLPAAGPPDREALRSVYEAHGSRLL